MPDRRCRVRSGAQVPMPEKASRARGFSRHMGSRGPPGVRSEMTESPLASVPKMKKHASAVTPGGRWDASGVFTGGESAALNVAA